MTNIWSDKLEAIANHNHLFLKLFLLNNDLGSLA